MQYVTRKCDSLGFDGIRDVLNDYRQEALSAYVLMLDLTSNTHVVLTTEECQNLARQYFSHPMRAIIVADKPHIFGMFRVIEGYAANDSFRVCRSSDEALDIVLHDA